MKKIDLQMFTAFNYSKKLDTTTPQYKLVQQMEQKYNADSSNNSTLGTNNAPKYNQGIAGRSADGTKYGLLPKTDYNYTSFAGNSNAQVNAMKNIGLTQNGNYGSGFGPQKSRGYYGDLSHFNSKSNVGYGYGGGTFKPSQAYYDAMAYTQSLLDKLNTGRTSYSDKIDELMGQIENRDKFSYDMDKDPLFQQYLASMMNKGKIAMQDTIGQASALTGGYGSTYATAAANGAYNDYIQSAYDNVSDYYGMALDAYNSEGQDLYNRLGMYQTADNTEYGRLSDSYGRNLDKANLIYNQEYQNFNDAQDRAYKYASLNASQKTASANAKASANEKADEGETGLKSILSNSNQLSMLQNLAEQGMGKGSAYMNALDNLLAQGVDIGEIDDYIRSNLKPQLSVYDKGKWGLKDNTYSDQYGNIYDRDAYKKWKKQQTK